MPPGTIHYRKEGSPLQQETWLSRTALLLGEDSLTALSGARVALLGLGGVGGAAAEALARSGIGSLLLVDHDTVELTNLNRQLLATRDTLGLSKAQAARQRILSINPDADVQIREEFYLPDNCEFLYEYKPDFVLDAIDTVTAKLHLAQRCHQQGIPLLMCLGTGNRLDPSQLRIGDISQTAKQGGCPLARVMRRELPRRGVPRQDVLYSLEPPRKPMAPPDAEHGRHPPGSTAFVPPAAGLLMASYTVRCLLNRQTYHTGF